MPIYEYRAAQGEAGCAHCANGFEIKQSIADPKLTKCPECGGRIVRPICAVGLNTKVPSTRTTLSDSNLKKHGFTKLINEGDGKLRKV